MKLIVNENLNISETEVVINCSVIDDRLRNLVDYLRQYSYSHMGTLGDSQYFVSVENILYIDSMDKSTFFYDKQCLVILLLAIAVSAFALHGITLKLWRRANIKEKN